MKRGAIVIHKNEPGEIFRVKKLFGESKEFAVVKRISHPQPMTKFGMVVLTAIVLRESLTII